ncbi:hypothetical protein [Lacipirellula limnantheis]|uniref:Uncharacterized protein n=1 Tax=Lacipirellula limnantheis TaxID=2528024 RepID=A0A517U1K7_9BACT|nr:hypothetical protein [Lacipirellula limnantheis]QDT74521.1 hypothetical protein I41_37180 [Lacipirellula limnantheis]
MAKYVRYALASVCFAASVACLALWWRSMTRWDALYLPNNFPAKHRLSLSSVQGMLEAKCIELGPSYSGEWAHYSSPTEIAAYYMYPDIHTRESFGGWDARKAGVTKTRAIFIWFPHWYAALIFALLGVGVLRFRRQFSIRSAMICLTVVAALLGMAVVL